MIGLINYGMGNLGSVSNAFRFLNIPLRIIESPVELASVDKCILPGVGAFGRAMENLTSLGFAEALSEAVLVKKKPILGICLGMQLLLDSSTEFGEHKGLGFVRGRVLDFGERGLSLPVPHVGWNEVTSHSSCRLFAGIPQESNFYFVHSYYCQLDDRSQVTGTTSYEIDFDSSLETGFIFGCQFHPEKSQRAGLTIFKNFDQV